MRSTVALFSLVALGLAGCGQTCEPQPKKKKSRCRSEAVQEQKALPTHAKAEKAPTE